MEKDYLVKIMQDLLKVKLTNLLWLICLPGQWSGNLASGIPRAERISGKSFRQARETHSGRLLKFAGGRHKERETGYNSNILQPNKGRLCEILAKTIL